MIVAGCWKYLQCDGVAAVFDEVGRLIVLMPGRVFPTGEESSPTKY